MVLEHLIVYLDIKQHTPNLIEFKQLGYIYNTYSLENLSALVKAESDTSVGHNIVEFSSRLKKILEGMHNVESLSLSAHGFQTFAEYPEMLEWFPILCEKLKYLRLTGMCNYGYIHSIAKLLQCFPHIETLVLEISQRTKIMRDSESEEEDWRAQLSFDCTVAEKCPGTKGYSYPKTSKSSAEEKDLVTFSNQIRSLPKATSAVAVSLAL